MQEILEQQDVSQALVEQARAIAQAAHAGQVDKAGRPYLEHLQAVAQQVGSNKARCVAYMHDLLEDTDYPREQVLAQFGPEIYAAVCLMTHKKEDPYLDYVRKIAKNPLARAVKLADLANNMDLTRLPDPQPEDYARVENKYRPAREILLHAQEAAE